MTLASPLPGPAGSGPLPSAPALPIADSLRSAGIGEFVLSPDPAIDLIAYGLGSCVALSAWDPRSGLGGLAHFMLPSGSTSNGGAVKFVDPGLSVFLDAFVAAGGSLARAELKAAGGAAMLAFNATALEIGRRNAQAVERGLTARGLQLVATDVGGSSGRTVQLQVATGRLLVRSVVGSLAI